MRASKPDASLDQPFSTPQEVEDEVACACGHLPQWGGYILLPLHDIQGEPSPANIVTMCQAAQHFGQYPIKPFEHIRRSIDIIP